MVTSRLVCTVPQNFWLLKDHQLTFLKNWPKEMKSKSKLNKLHGLHLNGWFLLEEMMIRRERLKNKKN